MQVNKKAVTLLLNYMKMSKDLNIPKPEEYKARAYLSYLDAFGYLTQELAKWKDISLGDIVSAITQFQEMFGIVKTGHICEKTIRAMALPRCGCPDIDRVDKLDFARLKDFANNNLARWQKTGITYKINDYIPGISKNDFESIIYSAFQNWCQYGNIEVNPATSGQIDVIISIGQGPRDNFDNTGVLAWSYLPDGNDNQLLMKFNIDETWITNPNSLGIIITNVACHEFGHLLGLSHSRLQSALMAPYYNAAVATPQQQDDIPRLQARYGVKITPLVPTVTNNTLTVTGVFKSVEVNGRSIAL